MTLIVHPLTAGDDNEPAYTADMFRRTNNVWLSPANSAVNTASSCISAVRDENDTPICTISGLKVTVAAHSGIVYPFAGGSPYTYYISDESVSIPNTTQSWKIAVVVTDPSVGYGNKPGATLQAVSSTTPDSNINGIVLALVNQGVVYDIVPRILNSGIIQTQTLESLQQISTTDGQRAYVSGTDADYVRRGGAWYCTRRTLVIPHVHNTWWISNDLHLAKHDDVVNFSLQIGRLDSPWNGDNGNTFTTNIPEDMRPARDLWAYLDNRVGLYLDFTHDGKLLWGRDASMNYATMAVGAVLDMCGSYILGQGPIYN